MTFIEKALDEALREFAADGHDGDILVEAIAEEMQRNPLMRRELQATLRTLIILALPRAREMEIMERGQCEKISAASVSGTLNGTDAAASPRQSQAPATPLPRETSFSEEGNDDGETRGFDFHSRLELSHLVYAPAPEPVDCQQTRSNVVRLEHSEAILGALTAGKKPLMSGV